MGSSEQLRKPYKVGSINLLLVVQHFIFSSGPLMSYMDLSIDAEG